MTDIKPVTIISDNPEKNKIMFGFDAYARTIASLIANKDNSTPMVIGIYGSWGSGKTTLMELVRDYLKGDTYANDIRYRKAKTVWFQAWKFGQEDTILAALIEEIFRTMKRDGFLQDCKAKIEQMTEQFKSSKILGKLTKLAGFDISELFTEMEYKKKLGFYDRFQDFFDRLLWDYLKWRPKKTSTEQVEDKDGVLVVFIDDLDRCPEDRIVRVLETIKLFMDKKGCVFVLGAANEMIKKALAGQYGEDEATRFMDKIVQVNFNLPRINESDFDSYIKSISPDIDEKISPHLPLIIRAVQNNPRQLKRFLNNLNLQAGILGNKGVDISFDNLLYWSVIEYAYPLLWNEIKDNPQIFFLLKKHILDVEKKLGERALWEITDEDLKEVPRSLWNHIKVKELTESINSFDIDEQNLQQLISLSEIVESADESKFLKAEKPTGEFDEMTEIPSGEFLYGDDKVKKEISSPFLIGIYPVTNGQFDKFIKAGGYENDTFWSQDGFEWRKEKNIIQPEYWNDDKWNKADHPVVGVSFYEAEAYANWAGARLPTEEEWESAARGTDGREYPWGNEFDKDKCNSIESNLNGTSKVTRYPNGISPAGCYDMAGNVWEWTSSLYDEKGSYRVVRGGGCYYDARGCRSAVRSGYPPDYRGSSIGFRLSRSVTLDS